MIRRILPALLCQLMGLIFLYSAYTKLYPIEPFEYTFVDLGIGNWQMAPFIARLLIGTEFIIGFLLIFNIRLKKFTYKLSIGILLVFCIYLILQLIFTGNKGNCGCFGTAIFMTPAQALVKNIIMLAVFWLLYRFYEGWNLGKLSGYLFYTTVLAGIALPFILNPVELNYSASYLNKPEENFKLELDSLYVHAKVNVPPVSLSTGKHIIAFMSLTCPHCRIAAKKMRIIHERNPEIPFYFVLNGKEENLKKFFDDTHTENFPYCILNGRSFVYLAGTVMPAIYLVNNGIVEHDVDYIDLDQKEVEKWLQQK